MSFTFEQKLYAVRRELSLRKQVYPGMVRTGRMEKDEADKQVAIMQEIADDYQRAVDRQAAKTEAGAAAMDGSADAQAKGRSTPA